MWLSSPACKSVNFSRLSFHFETQERKQQGKEELHTPHWPENATISLCLSPETVRLVCPVRFIAYLPLLILQWWYPPLHLHWIKTEMGISSSSCDPSPDLMGFRWLLMHLVVKLCFHVFYNPHMMGDLFHHVQVMLYKYDPQKVSLWSQGLLGNLVFSIAMVQEGFHPSINILDSFFPSLLIFVRFLCQRPAGVVTVFSPCWPRLKGTSEGPSLTPYFDHACKLILSASSVCPQIRV